MVKESQERVARNSIRYLASLGICVNDYAKAIFTEVSSMRVHLLASYNNKHYEGCIFTNNRIGCAAVIIKNKQVDISAKRILFKGIDIDSQQNHKKLFIPSYPADHCTFTLKRSSNKWHLEVDYKPPYRWQPLQGEERSLLATEDRAKASGANGYPWLEGLRQQQQWLSAELLSNEPRIFLSLPCTNPAYSDTPIPAEELLSAMLQKEKKIALRGEATGNDITLTLQRYALDRLNSYREGDPIPLYVRCKDLKDPQNFINEVLARYNLEIYLSTLQQVPTLWIIDGYFDEVKEFSSFPTAAMRQTWKSWKYAQFICATEPTALTLGLFKKGHVPASNNCVTEKITLESIVIELNRLMSLTHSPTEEWKLEDVRPLLSYFEKHRSTFSFWEANCISDLLNAVPSHYRGPRAIHNWINAITIDDAARLNVDSKEYRSSLVDCLRLFRLFNQRSISPSPPTEEMLIEKHEQPHYQELMFSAFKDLHNRLFGRKKLLCEQLFPYEEDGSRTLRYRQLAYWYDYL